jgi:hypothetical protein
VDVSLGAEGGLVSHDSGSVALAPRSVGGRVVVDVLLARIGCPLFHDSVLVTLTPRLVAATVWSR